MRVVKSKLSRQFYYYYVTNIANSMNASYKYYIRISLRIIKHSKNNLLTFCFQHNDKVQSPHEHLFYSYYYYIEIEEHFCCMYKFVADAFRSWVQMYNLNLR